MKLLPLCLMLLLFPGPGRAAEELQDLHVRQGQTLREVAKAYLKDGADWRELLRHNRLPSRDPEAELPAMSLKAPVSMVKESYRAARLTYLLSDVLLRRADSSDWNSAFLKQQLYPRDVLRTRGTARAEVRFYDGEMLDIAHNSMIVLRPPVKKIPEANMMVGVLHSRGARVITRTAVVIPKTKDTEFDTRMGEDLVTVVDVRRGVADVKAQGKTVEVAEGFRVEVKEGLAPSEPFKPSTAPLPGEIGYVVEVFRPQLPGGGAPGILAGAPGAGIGAPPPGGGAVAAATMQARLDTDLIRMLDIEGAMQGAHIQVSNSRDFSAPLLDKKYSIFEYIDLTGVLPSGNYFYRAAPIDLLGYEGKFGAAKRIWIGSGR